MLASASLLPTRVRVSSGRRAVALAVGHLDPPPAAGAPPRKACIVVVTAGWSVLAFDHNLRLLWENTLSADFPARALPREVAALLTSHSVRVGDRGTVIVGGSVELAAMADGDQDALEAAAEAERRQRSRQGGAGPRGAQGDPTLLEVAAEAEAGEAEGAEAELRPRRGLDRSHHFNYYAFEGRSGQARRPAAAAQRLKQRRTRF